MDTFPINPALEAAVVADADEDTPRLAYADWLDEHGDHDRAEFIRVQIAIANSTPADDAWFDLRDREELLTPKIGSRGSDNFRYKQAIPSRTRLMRHDYVEPYQRGFPFAKELNSRGENWSEDSPTRIARDLADLIIDTTIRGITLHAIPPAQFPKLLSFPAFAKLKSFAFSFDHWQRSNHATAYRCLADPTVSRNLQDLTIGVYESEIADAVAFAGAFPNLFSLCLSTRQPSAELSHLLDADWVQKLRKFQALSYTASTAVEICAGVGKLADLHTLELLPDYGAVLNAEHLAKGRFPKLAALRCPDARMKLRGLEALCKTDWFAHVRELDLSKNELGDRATVALAAHPIAKQLCVLQIGDNPFKKPGLLPLADGEHFPELKFLDLRLTNSTKRKAIQSDLVAFLRAVTLPKLRRFDLGGLPIGDEGVNAIIANPAFANLTQLFLRGCGISEDGKEALENSPVRHAVVT